MTFDSTPMSQARGVEHLVTYANGDQGRAIYHGYGDMPIVSQDEDGYTYRHDKEGLCFVTGGILAEGRSIAGYRQKAFRGAIRLNDRGEPTGPFIVDNGTGIAGDDFFACQVILDSPTAREGVAS